ncbi:DUF4105 domain-containing protein [Lujinxingia vulgaris]|uniref:DUF4105 domain-containing protein n=1 Tax=Lujinxingia vulgaris TaxID=2600176 RepID=A0A5C6WY96_9DELT|nr:DUF4105 domain-containing protein [Lujinxingia vulgaris]TXD34422.1 DUF4105 domain-containing protein [Lujinxingia vulgaris]
MALTITLMASTPAQASESEAGEATSVIVVDDGPREEPRRSEAIVERLRREFGMIVAAPDAWHPGELAILLKGADALPRALFAQLRQKPVRLVRRNTACLYGVGRYSESCPTFGKKHREFYIYESPPLLGEGPVEEYAVLTREEQRELQLRRAVVHLAMTLEDRARGWSEDARWQQVNGWHLALRGPHNQDVWGYARPMGMRSAHLDLVTFAEAYFVRPEDLLLERQDQPPVARRLEELDPNTTLGCQSFTASRALRSFLSESSPEWEEPARVLPQAAMAGARCPAFETWARLDDLDGFDVLLAAATSRPQSLYGHLLLHVKYRGGGLVRGVGFEPVYQFGALTDSDVDPIDYLIKGVVGGFPTVLELNTFRGVDRLFLQYEQRNLRRYTLQLNREQSQRLLERLWESERRTLYPYRFLNANCASFLVDLMEPALGLELPERDAAIIMPTDVLDLLASVDNGEQGRLLIKRPDTLRSGREVAQEGARKRRALLLSLADAIDADRPTRASFDALLEALEDPEPTVRERAYANAEAIFSGLAAEHPDQAQLLVDTLYNSVLVERFFMDNAHYARRALLFAAQGPRPRLSAQELIARRRELYRHEDLVARAEAQAHWAAQTTINIDPATVTWNPDQQAVLDHEAQTRASYLRALQAQSSLIDAHLPDWDGVAYLDTRAQRYLERMQALDARSKAPSGRHRLTLGGGATDQLRTHLELSYSPIEDRLGEVRQRGYRGDIESRVFGLDLAAEIGPDLRKTAESLQADLVIFRYASLQRTYGAVRRSFLDAAGWGLDLRVSHDGRRDLYFALTATPTLLMPVWRDSNDVNHLVVGLGAYLGFDAHRENTALLGADLQLRGQVHLFGSYANVLRLWASSAQLASLPGGWRYEVRGGVAADLKLATFGETPLVAGPFIDALYTTRDYRPLETGQSPFFGTWRAGLRVELPF